MPTPTIPCVPHPVAVLALPSVVPFDLGIPCQVFGSGRADLGAVRYRLAVCAPVRERPARRHRFRIPTASDFAIVACHGLGALRRAETIVVPGIADLDRPVPQPVLDCLRAAHARGARVVSICTGAFVLAAAGLLDGRRATTHWREADLLAAWYPRVQVLPDVLYVDEGQVLTSAGIAAGVDLCLHLVRRDYGAEVANAVARRLVAAPHRSGGQAQYAELPVPRETGSGLEATRNWITEQLGRQLSVDTMAAYAGRSRRTFVRHFRAETGTSPLQWVLHQRILRARHLLETTRESVEGVAARSGFGSAINLRQHFRRITGVSPLAYRRTYQGV